MKYNPLSELSQKAFIDGICVNCYFENDVKEAVNKFVNIIRSYYEIHDGETLIKTKAKEIFGRRILND